jgi:AraC-like DNA-binding protein
MFSNVRFRVSASVLRGILRAALPDNLFDEAADRLELSPQGLRQAGGLVALSTPRTLWGVLLRLTGDPLIGVRAAERLDPSDLGLFSELLSSHPDLNGVYTASLRYLDLLHSRHRPTLRVVGDVGELRWGSTLTRAGGDFVALTSVRIAQRLVPEFHLREHWFNHAFTSDEREVYEEAFGCPVSDRGELVGFCDAALLSRPIATANRERREELAQKALEQIERSPREVLRCQINDAYRSIATDRGASIKEAAKLLNMSSATLQRRLREIGTSHRTELDKARYLRASEMLSRAMPVVEVATRVGFHEARAFRRAFRRWSGVSPQEFRKRRRGAARPAVHDQLSTELS